METLKTKKEVNALGLLFAFTYMVSYITRINFGAVISEMERATLLPRALLSMSVTGAFVTYGAGQIISGIIGDRISPKKLLGLGLAVTTAMNILLPFCADPYVMLVCWSVNGFAQAFMWPPLVRMMTVLLTDEEYRSVSLKVQWGCSVGTMVVYLMTPILIAALSWKWVFWTSAAIGGVTAAVWLRFAPELPSQGGREASSGTVAVKQLLSPMMLGIMAAIILMGMLRDGVTTWMPTYISETYKLGSAVSILTGVILPIFSMLSCQAASWLYRKKISSPIACSVLVFILGAVAAAALYLVTGRNAVLSVAFSALLTGCMHGVNFFLISMVPAYFKRFGNISTVSGMLNACTYVGSAISTYGIAVLSGVIGWSYTVLLWAAIALMGAVICVLCAKPWQRKFAK